MPRSIWALGLPRWAALESHFKRLSELHEQYKVIRLEYNESTVDELVEALKIEEEYLTMTVEEMREIVDMLVSELKKASNEVSQILANNLETKQ